MRRKLYIKLYNTLKTRCHAGIWEICRLIHILAWIYRSCIVIHKALVLDGSLQYVYCIPYVTFLQIFLLLSMTWYVYFNRLPCPNDNMYNDHVFAYRFLLQMITFGMCTLIWLSLLLHDRIAYEIAIAKITAEICWISIYWAWFDTVEFNRLPCLNDRMYDDEGFADPFSLHLTMFEIRIGLLIGISRLLRAHIGCEIVI